VTIAQRGSNSFKKVLARDEALAQITMLVGGLIPARSTKGDAISEDILHAVRAVLMKS
jgi:TetR/AcrR family transcriptional repressor of nem operon